MSHDHPGPSERRRRGEQAAHDDGLVWHYTSGAGLISILDHDVVWATAAPFLNDQQEVELGSRRIADRLAERASGADPEWYAPLLARMQAQATGAGHSRFYILSASRSWDSLAMWRLYGGAQESYAIGLDAGAPLSVLAPGEAVPERRPGLLLRHQRWQPVRYAEAEQHQLIDEFAEQLPQRVERLVELIQRAHERDEKPSWELPPEAEDLVDDLHETLLLIKHEGFVDERESRYSIVLATDPDEALARDLEVRAVVHRATAYGIAPYLQLTGRPDGAGPLVTTPSTLPIRAVAISPSPNGEAATESVERLLDAHGYPGVPVLRSAIPFRT